MGQRSSATHHRDLRTGIPLWLANGRPRVPVSNPDSLPKRVDVAVIGSGITGAMLADALTAVGFSVVVLDRRLPCSGSTPASTALLQFEIDTPLIVLGRKIGVENARRAWLRSLKAVDDLSRRVAELRIECDFKRRSAIYLPGNVLDVAGLKSELAARQKIGLPSELLDRDELRRLTGIAKPAALISTGGAEVDPVKLAAGLLRRASARGASIFAPIDVADVAPCRTGVTVTMADGRGVDARFVVFATGYEVPKGVPLTGHKIISTWTIATAPQPDRLWPGRELIWEAADPYLYIRTTADGRVLAGGEDEDFSDADQRDALIATKTATLQRKLKRLFPDLDMTPEYRWAGSFGESATGLPSIGAVPRMKGCYAVLGYGGNGITFSMMAAQIIQRTLCGITDPDADLFGLSA
jgi:glycine/D-amino acid oxidase-like deaminating enzyme